MFRSRPHRSRGDRRPTDGIEIKGPRDSVTRLPGQAKAYSQCFDHVVLIVHESLATKARALIPDWWGLIAGRQVDGRIRYRVERRPGDESELELEKVLSLLWREEIDALLSDLLGSNSKPRATKKSIRAELLAQVEPPILHHASLRKLRDRTAWRGVASLDIAHILVIIRRKGDVVIHTRRDPGGRAAGSSHSVVAI